MIETNNKQYNDTAMEVANQMLYTAVKNPELVEATKSQHDITLEQAILVSHLKRHLGLEIVSPVSLNREWAMLEHERVMLNSWKTGDTSLLPDGWSIEKQEAYILGIETTLNNLYSNVQ